MPLRTKSITVPFGRDKGKRFDLVEMPARQADRWSRHMAAAICKSGNIVQPEQLMALVAMNGMEAIANIGLVAILASPPAETDPLFDELFERCVAMPTGANNVYRGAPLPNSLPPSGGILEGDIEDPLTFSYLRSEVFELHTGFSFAAHISQIFQRLSAARNLSTTTPTSADQSVSSSQQAKQA